MSWKCNKCGTYIKAMQTVAYCVDYNLKKTSKDPEVIQSSKVRSSAAAGISMEYFCPKCHTITDEDVNIRDIAIWED